MVHMEAATKINTAERVLTLALFSGMGNSPSHRQSNRFKQGVGLSRTRITSCSRSNQSSRVTLGPDPSVDWTFWRSTTSRGIVRTFAPRIYTQREKGISKECKGMKCKQCFNIKDCVMEKTNAYVSLCLRNVKGTEILTTTVRSTFNWSMRLIATYRKREMWLAYC